MLVVHYHSQDRPYKRKSVLLTYRDIERIIKKKYGDEFCCKPCIEFKNEENMKLVKAWRDENGK